jgi:hypothetical protein
MRTQPRSAAFVTAVLLAVGSALAASGFAGLSVAHGDEVAAEADAEASGDRTNSPEYTASRADYWEARAAYEARKAATRARKAGLAEAGESEVEPSGESSGFEPAGVEPAALEAPVVAEEPGAVAEPSGGPSAEEWAALRECESGNDYGINTGNGYYGAYQFSPITWWWLGYQGYPHQAPAWVQDQAALDLWRIYGWSPWPGCSRALGFR